MEKNVHNVTLHRIQEETAFHLMKLRSTIYHLQDYEMNCESVGETLSKRDFLDILHFALEWHSRTKNLL